MTHALLYNTFLTANHLDLIFLSFVNLVPLEKQEEKQWGEFCTNAG